MSSPLRDSAVPLSQRYDVAMLDLDGVVYVGPDAVPGVPQALQRARSDGMRLAFVTNNAARTPQVVAAHLTELGIAAEPSEVITSSQAAARYLAERLPAGARVLVLGTTGLIHALTERGLTPVHEADGAQGLVDGVVQGFSPEMDWALLCEGAVAINRQVLWVATNVDPTVPSPRGPLPGNGSLVKALQHATRTDPVITGKPDPTMHRETVLRTGARTPLVVGDRLDTDIEGANAVGCDSVLVFSGVTTLRDLLRAEPQHRPTYVGQDLSAILTAHPAVQVETLSAQCGHWRVRVTDLGADSIALVVACDADGSEASDGFETSDGRRSARAAERRPASTSSMDGSGFDEDQLDAIRAVCGAVWGNSDGGLARISVTAAEADRRATEMIAGLGLNRD